MRVKARQGCGVAGWATRVGDGAVVLQQYTRWRDKAGMDITAVTASPVVLGRWRSRRGVGEESGAGDAGVGRNCSRVLVCKRTDQGSCGLMPHPDMDSRARAGSGSPGSYWAFDLQLDMQVRYSATANRAVIGARAIHPRSVWKHSRRGCVCSRQLTVCAARDNIIATLTNQSMILFTPS